MKARKTPSQPKRPARLTPAARTVRGEARAYTSRLTPRGQTVIPQALREALGLRAGDILRYEVAGGKLVAEKLVAVAAEDPFAFFTEWDSPADNAAFAYLSDVVQRR